MTMEASTLTNRERTRLARPRFEGKPYYLQGDESSTWHAWRWTSPKLWSFLWRHRKGLWKEVRNDVVIGCMWEDKGQDYFNRFNNKTI